LYLRHRYTNTWLIRFPRFIETHSRTLTNAIALFCSIGGWFLWNIILSLLYKTPSQIYYVRATFLQGFGASLTWWLPLIVILATTLVFEFGVQALRASFLATDEDVFQALEKDPSVKRRFEEAASGELQMGWDRVKGVGEDGKEKEQERREKEVGDLLRNRGDGEVKEEGDGGDVDRVLSRGFGVVRV
jgi:phospholipid-translocating ATPase